MAEARITRDGGVELRQVQPGATLGEILNSQHHTIDLPCGGLGRCHRCRVVAGGELSAPTADERKALSEAELAAGMRFACQARALGDVHIELVAGQQIAQVLGAQAAAQSGRPLYSRYGVAVDIGTTTLAAQLYGGGKLLASASGKNPQTAFGADVLTRMGAAMKEGPQPLADSVRGGLEQLIQTLCGEAGIDAGEIDALVLAGNTTMQYLLCGQNPEPLSHAPFEADRLFGEVIDAAQLLQGLAPGAKILLPRCISAFVGADITAAVLASGLYGKACTSLLIDIGTNGEIVLCHDGKLLCCSTAAGPAFEGVGIEFGSYALAGAVDRVWEQDGAVHTTTIGGAAPKSICGSGIIDAVATMLQAGVVDETGAFEEPPAGPLEAEVTEYKGHPALHVAGEVLFTAEDVRKVQLGKGAIRAGIETLLSHAGVDAAQVETLYIAGGFGNYLDIGSAAAIGLVPPALAPKTIPIGNAALAGAAMMLQDGTLEAAASGIAQGADTVDLGTNPVFMDNYMRYMMFDEE